MAEFSDIEIVINNYKFHLHSHILRYMAVSGCLVSLKLTCKDSLPSALVGAACCPSSVLQGCKVVRQVFVLRKNAMYATKHSLLMIVSLM